MGTLAAKPPIIRGGSVKTAYGGILAAALALALVAPQALAAAAAAAGACARSARPTRTMRCASTTSCVTPATRPRSSRRWTATSACTSCAFARCHPKPKPRGSPTSCAAGSASRILRFQVEAAFAPTESAEAHVDDFLVDDRRRSRSGGRQGSANRYFNHCRTRDRMARGFAGLQAAAARQQHSRGERVKGNGIAGGHDALLLSGGGATPAPPRSPRGSGRAVVLHD